MFNHIAPVTRNIIGANIILFIISEYFFPELKFLLSAYLPSSPNFHSWQVITHMFMHGSLMHLVFNMFTLFSFGTYSGAETISYFVFFVWYRGFCFV